MKLLYTAINKFAGIILFAVIPASLFAQYDYRWQTDGTVNAAVIKNNVLYIGGQFSYVGRYHGNFVSLDPVTGNHDPSCTVIPNDIQSIISDGAGGWFIGGSFRNAGNETRDHLVRLRPDKTVDPTWNVSVSGGQVSAIKLVGNTLYIGGLFSNVGGLPRNRIAAIDIPTATVTPWNPGANGDVSAIEVAGSMIYAGGNFTSIGGQPRVALAELDASTGAVTSFNANLSHPFSTSVHTLCLSGNTLIAGGGFASTGGVPRQNLAAFDVTTGTLTPWNPAPNGSVWVVRLFGDKLYVGGTFSNISATMRGSIACFDAATGLLTAWNPNSNGWILDLYVDGNLLYAGGQFTAIGGQSRRRIAALDININTNNATSWDPTVGNGSQVNSIWAGGGVIFAGGPFTSVNSIRRNNIAAIDLATNTLLPWNPNANGAVHALTVPDGGPVYAGGDFTTVGGFARSRLAAIDVATGSPTTWNPSANQTVLTLVLAGTRIYAGGSFTTINGQPRSGLAGIDVSGSLHWWQPNPNGVVRTLATDGTILYVGGDFTSIASNSRGRLAAFDLAFHTLRSWNGNANNTVRALFLANGSLYVGGDFTSIVGQARNYIVALDGSGSLTSWNPNPNGAVRTIVAQGSAVYAAGNFTTIGGQLKAYLAAVDATTGNCVTAWHPFATARDGIGTINTIAANASTMYVGGSFTGTDATYNFQLMYLPTLEALPINIAQFAVKATLNTCLVSWSGSAAAGTARYEVQRSRDGISFTTIDTRLSIGQGHYEVEDQRLSDGKYFYRLRVTDQGGAVYYSSVIKVSIRTNAEGPAVHVWNYGRSLSIYSREEKATVMIFSADGRLIMRRSITAEQQAIDLSSMATGLYSYSVINGAGERLLAGKIFLR